MKLPQYLPFAALEASGFEKRERVQAAIAGRPVDRPPVCFWHHFAPRGSGGNMAIETVNFFARQFDLDIAKVMSDIPYPMPRKAIQSVEDWSMVLDWGTTDNEFTASYVSAVRQVRAILGPGYPLLVTVYSPATWAMLFCAEYPNRGRFIEHFQQRPALVHAALGNIALNLRRLAAACIDAGADGLFFSCHACDETLPAQIYNEIARPYDLLALQGGRNGWINILHAHSDEPEIRLEDYFDFPIQALSWADVRTGRSIGSIRELTDKCLMGGWDRGSPLLTDPGADAETLVSNWAGQAREAVRQAGGKGIILAPGCSLPVQSTQQALAAYRMAVDSL